VVNDLPDYTAWINGNVGITGTVTITGAVTVTGIVSISGTVTVTGAVTVTGIVSIIGTVTITGAVTVTGSVTVSGTVAISGTVTVSGAVTVTGTVSITGTVTVTGAVTVTGSVTVSGTVAISGTVTISGTVAISGTVTITGSVTISGAVTITSGAVTISTVGATNIVLDLLTQGAYTERRSTLSNDAGSGGTQEQVDVDANYYEGKFFPRGCRGFIHRIFWYAKNDSGSDQTITFGFAVKVGMGELFTVSTVLPNGSTLAWQSITVDKSWNYDSLFIYMKRYIWNTSDGVTPYDRYVTSDGGVTWAPTNHRDYYQVEINAQTVGDVPVSGTVNNIEVPVSSTAELYGNINANIYTETTVMTFNGAGKTEYISLMAAAKTESHNVDWKVYCDGRLVFWWSLVDLNDMGYTASTPAISLTKITTNGICVLHLTLKFGFKYELKVTAKGATTDVQDVYVNGFANVIT